MRGQRKFGKGEKRGAVKVLNIREDAVGKECSLSFLLVLVLVLVLGNFARVKNFEHEYEYETEGHSGTRPRVSWSES